MVAAKRSRTAQGVAAERAILSDMGVIDDPFSGTMLATPWKLFVHLVRRWPFGTPPWSVTRSGLAARVLWHDAQLTASLDADIRQVAVVGAGYDTRSWRFRRDGVVYFELDHPATQDDKRRRAPRPGPTYVEADLNRDDAGTALVRAGLDVSQPIHVIVEGVTMYLTADVVSGLFTSLAAVSADGSRMATDFSPPRHAGTARDRRLLLAQRFARVGSGEVFRLEVDRAQAAGLMAASGWDVDALSSVSEVALELVPDHFGLPLGAINEHKLLALATVRR
jgi:methyltransferase (TIGR00027 family)